MGRGILGPLAAGAHLRSGERARWSRPDPSGSYRRQQRWGRWIFAGVLVTATTGLVAVLTSTRPLQPPISSAVRAVAEAPAASAPTPREAASAPGAPPL